MTKARSDSRGPRGVEIGAERFAEFVAANRPRIEGALGEWLPVSAAAGTGRFNAALRGAVFPGGKRLRPNLTLVSSRLGGASDGQGLLLACAVEFIHTSSLVLDDLPCMDDAELRRGRPALHVAFGEGVAILAAVALLNQAYALFAAAAEGSRAERLPALIREAAGCVGSPGMIAGQAAELALSGESPGEAPLASLDLKTTALMRLMMVAGGVISGAPDEEVAALATFGECLGRAYQIFDDLDDALGDPRTTGKSAGQDARHLRPTVFKGLSRTEARERAVEALERGEAALGLFDGRPEAALLKSSVSHILAAAGPALTS